MERIRRVLGKPELRQNRFSPLIIISGLTALSLIMIRPSGIVPGKQPLVAIQPKALTPARYESMELKISGNVKELASKKSSGQKRVKIKVSPDIPSLPVTESGETTEPPDMAYYADNKIPRDYSNQPAADLSQEPVHAMPGSPYIPSVSLAYDAQPVVIAADSMRDILIKNDISTIVCLANLKAIANLKELEIQIDKNKQELTRIEIENQKLFLPDQRKIKPLLKKMQKQIERKKIQVDVLRNKLEVSETEIIHI